jgi:hypothetical protein
MRHPRAEARKGCCLMFTFVIWAVGLYILLRIGIVNVALIGAAFESHWFLGVLAIIGSLIAWIILLALIF